MQPYATPWALYVHMLCGCGVLVQAESWLGDLQPLLVWSHLVSESIISYIPTRYGLYSLIATPLNGSSVVDTLKWWAR